MKAHMIHKMTEVIQKQRNQSLNIKTDKFLQSCSYKKMFWNMHQIYFRTPMPKCHFHVDKKQLYWNHTSAWVFICKFVAYF